MRLPAALSSADAGGRRPAPARVARDAARHVPRPDAFGALDARTPPPLFCGERVPDADDDQPSCRQDLGGRGLVGRARQGQAQGEAQGGGTCAVHPVVEAAKPQLSKGKGKAAKA